MVELSKEGLLSAGQARAKVAAGLETVVADLRRFRPGKRLMELTFFPSLWATAAALTLIARAELPPAAARTLLSLTGVLVSGVAINALVLLLHEGMHGTLFPNRFWNRWVSVLLGLPVLMSFTAYQVMHLRHHDFLGDPRDPDDYENYSTRPHFVWLMHFVRLTAGSFLYLLCIPSLAWRHGSGEQRRRLVEEYAVLAAVTAGAAWIVPAEGLLWCWFLPAVATGFMTNVRGFTQHGITDAHDPFLASRTIRPNPIVRFCLLNENYHLEHHLFPEVPSYHLPALHRLVAPRLPRGVVGRSYLGFLLCFLRATLTLDRAPIGLRVFPPIKTEGAGSLSLFVREELGRGIAP
jgi:fatty acid desaturase